MQSASAALDAKLRHVQDASAALDEKMKTVPGQLRSYPTGGAAKKGLKECYSIEKGTPQ